MGLKFRSAHTSVEQDGIRYGKWRSPITFGNEQNNRSSKSTYWLTIIGVLVLGLIIGYLGGYQHGWHNGYNGVGMAGIGGMFQSLSGVIKIVVILVIIAVLLWGYKQIMAEIDKTFLKILVIALAILALVHYAPLLPGWLASLTWVAFIILNVVMLVRWLNSLQRSNNTPDSMNADTAHS